MLDATQQDVSLGLAHMFDATQQDVSLGLAHMFDATEHWGGVGWGARHHSSRFCFCRPNMVAVLTVHVRHVKNARGWPFVLKNLFFLKLGFLVSYYVWINWN